MKLIDVLRLINGEDAIPDDMANFIPDFVSYVELAFTVEEETRVRVLTSHPMLIPWYDCPVESIYPKAFDTITVWLRYEPYAFRLMEERRRRERAKAELSGLVSEKKEAAEPHEQRAMG